MTTYDNVNDNRQKDNKFLSEKVVWAFGSGKPKSLRWANKIFGDLDRHGKVYVIYSLTLQSGPAKPTAHSHLYQLIPSMQRPPL